MCVCTHTERRKEKGRNDCTPFFFIYTNDCFVPSGPMMDSKLLPTSPWSLHESKEQYKADNTKTPQSIGSLWYLAAFLSEDSLPRNVLMSPLFEHLHKLSSVYSIKPEWSVFTLSASRSSIPAYWYEICSWVGHISSRLVHDISLPHSCYILK